MNERQRKRAGCLAAVGLLMAPWNAWGSPREGGADLAPFEVIGSKEAVFNLSGSGYYLEAGTVDAFRYDDVNQLLREVPGVYIREEDGYGLFPNISLRGADPGRSGKVTLMEDGVLTAPAPYAAPSAYYAPTAGRMAGLEVLKGSSQIRFGPHTTGGAINYLSARIPANRLAAVEVSYGSDADWIGRVDIGDTMQRGDGEWGYLLEAYHRRNDGFKTIAPAAEGGYAGRGDTGLERTDYLAKVFYSPGDRHRFELKLGYSDMEANETYLGLTQEDFGRMPLTRYAASRFDNIATYHLRTLARHTWTPGPDLTVATTAYYNRFHRNWYKLDRVNDASLSSILFNNDPLYPVLIGAAPGTLKVKANNRDYYLGGVQTDAEYRFRTGNWNHKLKAGLRLHTDRIRRYQWADLYSQDATGAVVGEPGFSGPDNEGDRRQAVDATSLYLMDEVVNGPWRFTPGLRVEWIDWDYFRADGRDPDIHDSGSFSMVAPGGAVQYDFSADWTAFAGYHRGISPPAPSGARGGLEEETANSFELGTRLRTEAGLYTELLFFHTGFENLVTAESVANGGSDENIGEVDVTGIEFLTGIDLGRRYDLGFGLPLHLALTWTDATFVNPTDGQTDPESIFFGAADGNRLPYIPEFQFYARAGLEFESFQSFVSVAWIDARFGTGDNRPFDPNDVRVGKLDAHWVVDLSAAYQVSPNLEVFGVVTNLFDDTYIASRLPHGLRPGAPRQARIGLRYRWQ